MHNIPVPVTKKTQQVLVLAEEEALDHRNNYVGTEHLLLGLIRDGRNAGVWALKTRALDFSKVRSAIDFIVYVGEREVKEEIHLTPRSRKVFLLGQRQARRLGHKFVSPGYLLLGILYEGEGIAAGVLESLGITLEDMRLEVAKRLVRRKGT